MARHMRDLLLGALAFGDVVVGGDPAAVGHRMVEHGDGAAVRQLDQLGHGGAGRRASRTSRSMYWSMSPAKVPDALRCSSSSRSVQPGFTTSRRQAVHPAIALVADHQPPVAVEHQQRLRHVVDGGLEAQVLRLELRLALAQRRGAHLDQLFEPAVERVELLDHQRDRAVGAAAVAVGLLVGRGDELAPIRRDRPRPRAWSPWQAVWRKACARV